MMRRTCYGRKAVRFCADNAKPWWFTFADQKRKIYDRTVGGIVVSLLFAARALYVQPQEPHDLQSAIAKPLTDEVNERKAFEEALRANEYQYVAEKLIAGGNLAKPAEFQDEFCLFDQKDLTKLKSREKVLFVLLGPKCIGKTESMRALPSILGSPGLFMSYHFASGPMSAPDLFVKMYSHCRRLAHPQSPSRDDDPGEYISKVFTLVREMNPNFVILIDVRRAPETRALAVTFADEVRALQEFTGCSVVMTTSEANDFLASKPEPRRVVKLCSELSLEWCLKRAKQLLNERHNELNLRLKSGETPWPILKDEEPLPEKITQTIKTSPRHWLEVKDIVDRGGDDSGNRAARYEYQLQAIKTALHDAKCPHEFRPPWSEALKRAHRITTSDIRQWCDANDAADRLVKLNVLRPLMLPSQGAKDAARDSFAWQYDFYSEVIELMPKPHPASLTRVSLPC
jgi:hypothetical protein